MSYRRRPSPRAGVFRWVTAGAGKTWTALYQRVAERRRTTSLPDGREVGTLFCEDIHTLPEPASKRTTHAGEQVVEFSSRPHGQADIAL